VTQQRHPNENKIKDSATSYNFYSRESSICTTNAIISSNATLNPHMHPISYNSTVRIFSGILVQKHLRLVDLRGQVRASAAIGVVLHDHLAMPLADNLFVQTAFSVEMSSASVLVRVSRFPAWTYEHSRINAASLLFIVFSNPPL
jgi:hypothetical protein